MFIVYIWIVAGISNNLKQKKSKHTIKERKKCIDNNNNNNNSTERIAFVHVFRLENKKIY